MIFTEWENKTLLVINIITFSIQCELFNATNCEVDLFTDDVSGELNNYLWNWMQSKKTNDILFSNKIDKKLYFLENSYPIYLLTNNSNGDVYHAKFKVSKISEITRTMKINKILQ